LLNFIGGSAGKGAGFRLQAYPAYVKERNSKLSLKISLSSGPKFAKSLIPNKAFSLDPINRLPG